MSDDTTKLLNACVEYRAMVDKLEAENAELREALSDDACREIMRLRSENAALRADKERLDWLLTDDGGFWVNWMYDKDEWMPDLKASRDAIDACRNGRIGREKL